MDRITDAFNCARITHHRPGSILVVVTLDIAAVQDVAIFGLCVDEDGNDKSSNGEKNHRYDQGRRVGPHQWPPRAPEWLISLPSARSAGVRRLRSSSTMTVGS
jgi:hypothetical protein